MEELTIQTRQAWLERSDPAPSRPVAPPASRSFRSPGLAIVPLPLIAAGVHRPVLSSLCRPGTPNGSPAAPPNIVIIMADDMGFSDVGAYGSEVPTPHIDALAANGICFSQFYNTGRCCPTRAALLTGLYAHQAGVGWMTRNQGERGYLGRLNEQCVTLAEVLGEAGY